MNLLRRITALFNNRPGSARTAGQRTPMNESGARQRGVLGRLTGRR